MGLHSSTHCASQARRHSERRVAFAIFPFTPTHFPFTGVQSSVLPQQAALMHACLAAWVQLRYDGLHSATVPHVACAVLRRHVSLGCLTVYRAL